MPSGQTSRLLACMALALLLGLPALAGASADDFFVVLVYARNLLEGHGLNPRGASARDHPDGPAGTHGRNAVYGLAPALGHLHR